MLFKIILNYFLNVFLLGCLFAQLKYNRIFGENKKQYH